jgi:predicted TIM-barrel fold metal-dependent hydrolase
VLTPWGELPVADAHVHFFSHRFFSVLAQQAGEGTAVALAPRLGWDIPPEDASALADRWASELDQAGVHRAVLIASVPGDAPSVAVAVSRHPNRFRGYFMLNPNAPEAGQTAATAIAQGLRGICFFPAMHGYSMRDQCVGAVLEEARKHRNVSIFVHCGVLTVGVRRKLGLPWQFNLQNSNPVDLIPVASRYPDLTFVVPHFGAGYFREALMLADLCPNVVFDTSSSNSWMRYEGLDLATVFRRALQVVGPRRLRWGSDSSYFPRGWHREILDVQMKAMAEIGLGAADAAAILGGNLTAEA